MALLPRLGGGDGNSNSDESSGGSGNALNRVGSFPGLDGPSPSSEKSESRDRLTVDNGLGGNDDILVPLLLLNAAIETALLGDFGVAVVGVIEFRLLVGAFPRLEVLCRSFGV